MQILTLGARQQPRDELDANGVGGLGIGIDDDVGARGRVVEPLEGRLPPRGGLSAQGLQEFVVPAFARKPLGGSRLGFYFV